MQDTNTESRRIEYVDALKGIAIFCVLWGHSLQYLQNGYDFFHNRAFEFIYSFHMPLFFMISGFLFRSSLKLNLKDFLYKKSVRLLLPCITWIAVYYILRLLPAMKEFKIPYFWFLRELFISYFIVYVSLKFFKKNWMACLLSIVFVLIGPFCAAQRVFLPMFWAGLYLKDNYQVISNHSKHVLIISGIIFSVCLMFWDGNYTMYVTNFAILFDIRSLSFNLTNIDISLFRLLIGCCGSLFWFMLFKMTYRDNKFFAWLGKIGASSLPIYLSQVLILETLTAKMIDFSGMDTWIYNLITPLVSSIVLAICIALITIIQKNKYTELLLFGETHPGKHIRA